MDSDNNQETDHKTSQKTQKPVVSFRRTHEDAQTNIQILAAFNGNLEASIEAKTGIPLDYG